ncbi:addiction module protein [Nitratifractor sp.]
MQVEQLGELSIEERLVLMERILDSFAEIAQEPSAPAWHQKVLDHRLEALDRENVESFTIEELRRIRPEQK